MHIKNEKTKYKLIFIIVTVVMCIRCLGIKKGYTFSDEMIGQVICMVIEAAIFSIVGGLFINRLYKDNNMSAFVFLIALAILMASVFSAEDYIGLTFFKLFNIGFPKLYVSILRVAVTIILSTPFIIFAAVLFRRITNKAKKGMGRKVWVYRLWSIGGVIFLPLFVISNNYGTWFLTIAVYYLISTLIFVLTRDEAVTSAIDEIIGAIRSRYKWCILLLIYLVMFTPIDSVKVCTFVDNFIAW